MEVGALYNEIEAYGKERGFAALLQALIFIKESMTVATRSEATQKRRAAEFLHCLQVAEMLMDLHLDIPAEDEETLLTTAILHVYPENFSLRDIREKFTEEAGYPEAVAELLEIVTPEQDLMEEDQNLYYERVEKNRLALLLMLADRGNVVQQLYRYSTWNAHRYIEETKACYYPMCIYGKEHYHELLGPISVLLEKMRSLVEVAEILLRRYEVRESELIHDILALREENATIRGIIGKFRRGE